MSILAAFMVPHPPLIVPQVGRGGEKQIADTVRAYEQTADEIAALQPETVIISSPHAVMYSDYFHISPGARANGSFSQFGAPEVSFQETYDEELVKTIAELAAQDSFPAGTMGERDRRLDHGTMVPLYFIRKKYQDFRLVRIGLSGLPLADHYRLGQIVQEAVEKTGRRTVFVASGDLSHKLQKYGPYGFAPEGPEYDARIMDVCGRGAFGELFDFEETFCERAAECGHRSFCIMAGALDGVQIEAKQLSHEDVTGVGYGICTFYPSAGANGAPGAASGTGECTDPQRADRHFLARYLKRAQQEAESERAGQDEYVALARASLEAFVRNRSRIDIPEWVPEEMRSRKAGVFVSIHKHDRLRGCIGTILPTASCIAKEIIGNAISASTRDPRFDPIKPAELPYLSVSVDVLGEPERIESMDQLDVKRYGVIVSCGARRGLLLPDLDGVDTVEQQVAIAMRKGGISKGEKITLERFEVIRHH